MCVYDTNFKKLNKTSKIFIALPVKYATFSTHVKLISKNNFKPRKMSNQNSDLCIKKKSFCVDNKIWGHRTLHVFILLPQFLHLPNRFKQKSFKLIIKVLYLAESNTYIINGEINI